MRIHRATRAAFTMSLVICTYMLCWLPSTTMDVLWMVRRQEGKGKGGRGRKGKEQRSYDFNHNDSCLAPEAPLYASLSLQVYTWLERPFPIALTPTLMKWLNTSHYLPNIINPVIYAVRKEQFRRQVHFVFN